MLSDTQISVRFKYGIHTIYHFVDSLFPITTVSSDLLTLLRERYPDGLTKSVASPDDKTPIPEDAESVEFSVLKVPNDTTRGWRVLKREDGWSAGKVGLRENGIVAVDLGEGVVVEWPTFEGEEEEE